MQWIFTPVAHFSTFMVQRGTITMFGATGLVVGVVEEVRLETAERSIIIAVVMIQISGGEGMRIRPKDLLKSKGADFSVL